MSELAKADDPTELGNVDDARRKLQVSKSFLYKLPPDTPGVYVFGRSKRFCVEELKAWARERATKK